MGYYKLHETNDAMSTVFVTSLQRLVRMALMASILMLPLLMAMSRIGATGGHHGSGSQRHCQAKACILPFGAADVMAVDSIIGSWAQPPSLSESQGDPSDGHDYVKWLRNSLIAGAAISFLVTMYRMNSHSSVKSKRGAAQYQQRNSARGPSTDKAAPSSAANPGLTGGVAGKPASAFVIDARSDELIRTHTVRTKR
jgi:hypothetical protein